MAVWKRLLALLRRRPRALRPVALFLVLAVIPIGIWVFVDTREDTGLADLTDQYASNIATQIQAALAVRMSTFRALTERIANDPTYGAANFDASARRRMEELPGLAGLTWVDTTHIVRWGYPKTPAIVAMIGKDASKFPSAPYTLKAARTGIPAATPPTPLMLGGKGVVCAFPGFWNGQRIGSLGAVMAIDALMRVALGGSPSPNFNISVMDQGDTMYRAGATHGDSPFVAKRRIALLDREWAVVASPSAAYIAAHKTPTKALLLVVGLILSAGVALMYHAALDGRLRAEQNQLRFQEFAESATDWLWELDADLRYSYISPRVEAVYGFGPGKLIGQHRAELVWREDNPPEVLETYRLALAERRPFRNFEFRSRDATGNLVIARLSGMPTYDSAGRFTGYRGTGTNITDQVLARKATAEAEERLRMAMDTLPGGFLFYGPDGRLLMWNRFMSKVYPKAYPHFRVGMTFADMVNLVTPLHITGTGPELQRRKDRWIREFVEERKQEEEIVLNDGKVIQAMDWRTPDGATVSLRFDVTDAKRREEQLRNVKSLLYDSIEAVPAAFLLWDEHERLTMWNSTVEQVNGTLQGRLRTGMHVEEFMDIVSVDWKDSTSEAGRLAASKRRLADFRAAPNRSEAMLKDGRVIQIIDWRSINNATVSLSFDITDARRREEELRHAQKMEAVGQMTGGIAHDFNNLLTVIIGYTEFLRLGDRLSDRERESLGHVMGAAMRGAGLIKRLMMFSRAQPMEVAAVQPNRLIEELAPLLERTLGETIELVTDLDPAVGTIASDRGQLENVMMNLAINSRDAMRHGGKLILATSRKPGHLAQQTGPLVPGVEVRVTDTGEGMSEETLRRAFDPFFTTKGMGKGTGLGLSMVYTFAQAAHGNVTLHSALGQGTTVTLWLPEGGAAVAAAARETTETRIAEFGRGRRVLVVEDDNDVATYALDSLTALGFRPVSARNPREAQDLLQNHGPWNLLFTDVVLPGGMSGPELARWARKRFPGLPVLFTSGYVRQQEEEADLRPLLRKPYRTADLARELALALDTAAPALRAVGDTSGRDV
ncbi:MAG TPA: PAS-domain containing protein [bacterium]